MFTPNCPLPASGDQRGPWFTEELRAMNDREDSLKPMVRPMHWQRQCQKCFSAAILSADSQPVELFQAIRGLIHLGPGSKPSSPELALQAMH